MKNFLILGLTILTIQTALADGPGRGRDDRGPGRDDSRELGMCLRSLDDARRDADSCRRNSADPREMDGLRRDNQGLRDSVDNLRRENQDLRIQLDQTRPSRNEVFAYAACTDYAGVPNLKQVGSGSGMNNLEAESRALANTQKEKSCVYSVKIVKSEAIYSTGANSFCTAACTDYAGNPDLRKQAGVAGRNQTEAAFLAIKQAQTLNSCVYNVKVVSCQ